MTHAEFSAAANALLREIKALLPPGYELTLIGRRGTPEDTAASFVITADDPAAIRHCLDKLLPLLESSEVAP